MFSSPPARLNDRPLHSRSLSSNPIFEKPEPQDNAKTPNANTYAVDNSSSLSDRGYATYYGQDKFVKWGIIWHPPFLMSLYGVGGIGIAIGHHFYYSSLHGTQAGSSTRQQWATAIGTGTSFLVVTLLRAASCAAYNQYVWTLVKTRSYKLSTLDKLFALTTEPTGFFGWEMLSAAKIALLVALLCWITPLAGIAPPATLSVVPGLVIDTTPTSMPVIDWNAPAFYDIQAYFSLPSSKVQGVASQSALSMTVVPMTPPGPNSTFSMQFYGPAVQCSPPNSTQQKILDYYSTVARKSGQFVTKDALAVELQNKTQFQGSFPKRLTSFNPLVISAFAPYAGVQGWLYGSSVEDAIDPFNNWSVDLPWDMDELGGTVDAYIYDDVVQQLFVQTSTSGIFCMLGNASYDVSFEFVNGRQTATNYTTSNFVPIVVMRSGGGGGGSAIRGEIRPGPYNRTVHTGFELSYMAVWSSFTSLISGNVSMGYMPLQSPIDNREDTNLTLIETNSRILLNGLSACEEITDNYWKDLPATAPDNKENPAEFFDLNKRKTRNATNDFFAKPAWMCRNRTLSRAIEDLAGNITIGMLSSSSLTTPNSTLLNVTYSRSDNIYQYTPLPLLISYGIASSLSFICVVLGAWSFLSNGVVHSNSFSAMIATTRNPALEELGRGFSLGALPLDVGIAKIRLRFGELQATRRVGPQQVGFGFEEQVVEMEKFGKYV